MAVSIEFFICRIWLSEILYGNHFACNPIIPPSIRVEYDSTPPSPPEPLTTQKEANLSLYSLLLQFSNNWLHKISNALSGDSL